MTSSALSTVILKIRNLICGLTVCRGESGGEEVDSNIVSEVLRLVSWGQSKNTDIKYFSPHLVGYVLLVYGIAVFKGLIDLSESEFAAESL